jgi:hypothetical protein
MMILSLLKLKKKLENLLKLMDILKESLKKLSMKQLDGD